MRRRPNPINVFLSNDGTYSETPNFTYVPADVATWAQWPTNGYFQYFTDTHDLTGSSAQYVKFVGGPSGGHVFCRVAQASSL